MEAGEERRFPVDLRQPMRADIASAQRQEPGGADFPGVGDEYDPVTIADSESAGDATAANLVTGHPFSAHPQAGYR